jgi:nitrogen-specific signal transduction histidine kinase
MSEPGATQDLPGGGFPILDAVAAGVLLTDGAGRVRYANARAAEILERPKTQLLELWIDTLLMPLPALLDLSARKDHAKHELTVRLPSGQQRVISCTVLPAAAAPEVRYAATFQDVTSAAALRKDRDRLLQRSIVAELLPSIFHELRNPLASVINAVELMLEEHQDEGLRRDLTAVLREARRMDLGFQGFGIAGWELYSPHPTAVGEAIEEAVATIRPHATAIGFSLRTKIPPLPPMRLARAVIRGLVFNLVSHAIGSSRKSHTVEISAAQGDQGRTFELSVESSAEVNPRAADSISSLPAGRVIELLLCRRAVEAGGGELVIVPLPEGAQVTARLPLPEAKR